VHQNTLLKKVKRLEKDGIIRKHLISIDYDKLGYEMHAIVSIKFDGRLKNEG